MINNKKQSKMMYNCYVLTSPKPYWAGMISLNEAEVSRLSSLPVVGDNLFLIDRSFINSLSNQYDIKVMLLRISDDMGDSLAIALS